MRHPMQQLGGYYTSGLYSSQNQMGDYWSDLRDKYLDKFLPPGDQILPGIDNDKIREDIINQGKDELNQAVANMASDLLKTDGSQAPAQGSITAQLDTIAKTAGLSRNGMLGLLGLVGLLGVYLVVRR